MNQKVGITLTAEDKTQAAFNSVASSLGGLKTKSDSLFSAFSGGVAGGLVTGLFGAGFSTYVANAINDLDKLDESAERLGISVENLSALNFAGKLNGLEFEDMTTALTKLSSKMQDAAAGGKEASALFADVGVKVTDASGKIKPADAVLAEIAERFSRFEDGAAKTALAVDLFGKSGARMVPLLNGGADGLERMRKEAESLGGVIDSKLAKQAAEFNDNLDRLGTLSAAAGKSIAAEFLPALNRLTGEFLAARKAGLGFWESVFKLGTANPFKTTAEQIKELSAEAAAIEDRISIGRGKNGDTEKLAGLQKELAYYQEIERLRVPAESISTPGGSETIKRTESGDKDKKKKETAEASDAAKAYAKTMEDLAKVGADADASISQLTKSQRAFHDLMNSPEWKTMPETWKETARAQYEEAYAAELAADNQKRLNDLLGDAESSQIEKARDDMLLLVDALEKGIITEQQYTEAAIARLKLGKDDTKESVSEFEQYGVQAARNVQSALADFLFEPAKGGFDDMASNFGRVIQRMVAEAAAANIAKSLFGTMGQPTSSGGSGSWGWLGQAATWVGSFFADGGVMTSAGPMPLRKYAGGGIANSPQLALFGEGSKPEAYVPLPDGRRIPVSMQGGQGMTINQTIYAGQGTDAAQVRRSAAAGARSALSAMGGAKRYA